MTEEPEDNKKTINFKVFETIDFDSFRISKAVEERLKEIFKAQDENLNSKPNEGLTGGTDVVVKM